MEPRTRGQIGVPLHHLAAGMNLVADDALLIDQIEVARSRSDVFLLFCQDGFLGACQVIAALDLDGGKDVRCRDHRTTVLAQQVQREVRRAASAWDRGIDNDARRVAP